jgi:hypothetical protein
MLLSAAFFQKKAASIFSFKAKEQISSLELCCRFATDAA